MLQVCVDFRDEVDELHSFLKTLVPADWRSETGFMQWTPWDVVAHLHYFDLVSMQALKGEEVFAPQRDDLARGRLGGNGGCRGVHRSLLAESPVTCNKRLDQ